MTDAEFCEVLRQRALKVLDRARAELALHPENTQGRMAPHVAVDAIRKASRICRTLDALAEASQ